MCSLLFSSTHLFSSHTNLFLNEFKFSLEFFKIFHVQKIGLFGQFLPKILVFLDHKVTPLFGKSPPYWSPVPNACNWGICILSSGWKKSMVYVFLISGATKPLHHFLYIFWKVPPLPIRMQGPLDNRPLPHTRFEFRGWPTNVFRGMLGIFPKRKAKKRLDFLL